MLFKIIFKSREKYCNHRNTKRIIFNCISKPVAWFDKRVVDDTMNGMAWISNYASYHIRDLQSGQLQKYAFVFISGVLVLVLSFVYFFMN